MKFISKDIELETQSEQRPRLLIISAVLPIPRHSGQQVRVYNKLVALRKWFHITFLGYAPIEMLAAIQRQLSEIVDIPLLLPMKSRQNYFVQRWFGSINHGRALLSGLRTSNHLVGNVELHPNRIKSHIEPEAYDLVLFEYWHTHAATALFKPFGVPCVLDMHDVCWRVVNRRLKRLPIPDKIRRWRVNQYRRQEERAWQKYDLLVTINAAEAQYVQEKLPGKPAVYTPMGIDMTEWPYTWSPANPPRIAFYGSLGSLGNQQGVYWCLERILPLIWAKRPDVEIYIIGSNPPPEIAALNDPPRVHVTGFVPEIAPVLAQMSLILCPWRGKFGFRSRLIEAMAVGLPVVATNDAVFGMELEEGQGLFLHQTDEGLANHCLDLLQSPSLLAEQSRLARQRIEQSFSFETTYQSLADSLKQLAVDTRPASGRTH